MIFYTRTMIFTKTTFHGSQLSWFAKVFFSPYYYYAVKYRQIQEICFICKGPVHMSTLFSNKSQTTEDVKICILLLCLFFFIIVILFPEHWIWVCHNTFFKQRAWNRNKMFLSCPESVGHVVFSTYATSYWKPFCPILSRRECKGYDIINWIKMNSERCGG